MKILVIDQCSKEKNYRDDFDSFEESTIDNNSLEDLRERSQTPTIEARHLYAGRQQEFVSEAVEELRTAGDDVVRYFISAGFGLVGEKEPLPPYNVTFAEYSTTGEIRDRGKKLGIGRDLKKIVSDDFDIVFFILGSDYYESFDLTDVLEAIPSSTWVVCFNQESVADVGDNVVSLPAGNDEAKENGTIALALKGRYLQYFASHRKHGQQIETSNDIKEFCTTDFAQKSLDQYDAE